MSKILELRSKRASLVDAARAYIEANTSEDGTMTAESAAAYDKMEKEILDIGKQIDREENLANIENALKAPTTAAINAGIMQQKAEPTRLSATENYSKNFLQAVRQRFRAENVLQESVEADGGYLVPDEWESKILEAVRENTIMRSLATVIRTQGTHKINVGGAIAAAAWVDEGAKMTFGDDKFAQIELDAFKIKVGVQVTEELLEDERFNLVDYITRNFGIAAGELEEAAFWTGDGTKKPTGVFDTTGGGTFAPQLAAALKGDDIIDLIYSLKAGYRKNACFVMPDTSIKDVYKLKDQQGQYLWQPSLQMGQPDRLGGYPVYATNFAPEDKIAFGDFSYYKIGDRGQRKMKRLEELYAEEGKVGFTLTQRVDGKLTLKEAVQILTKKAG